MLLVRPSTPLDYPVIQSLLYELELDYPTQDLAQFWVAIVENKIIGIVYLQFFNHFIYFSSFGIALSKQKNGFAKQFLNEILFKMNKPVYIYTIIPSFFEKFGFKLIDQVPEGIPDRANHRCDICLPEQCLTMVFDPSEVPVFPTLRPLSILDIPLLQKKYLQFSPKVCELCLANLFLWREVDKPSITQLNENILICLDSQIEPAFFLEPIGEIDLIRTIQQVLDAGYSFSRLCESFINHFSGHSFSFEPIRNHFDYIFSTQDLAEFKGRKYDGKRNHIKKFISLYPDYFFTELTSKHQQDIFGLFETWAAHKKSLQELDDLSYQIQKKALEQTFQLWNDIQFFACGIYIQKQLKGFIIASTLNSITANIHFFHAYPQISGISQLLIQKACQTVLSSFQFLNFEQDLGLTGLRKGKESYQPVYLEKKFKIVGMRNEGRQWGDFISRQRLVLLKKGFLGIYRLLGQFLI